MFPRPRRIGKGGDILKALRQGRRSFSPVSTCYFLAKRSPLSRVAVIVDTKVSKKAVERNRLKRRARAILRPLPLPAGDLIVRMGKASSSLPFQSLSLELQKGVKKVV